MCCPNLEAWFYRHRYVAVAIGVTIYLPILVILEMLWLSQLCLTVIINLFIIVICCNLYPHKKLLKIKEYDKTIDGIMLETQYLKTAKIHVHNASQEENKQLNNCERSQISILQLNAFGIYDRFWQRYPLLVSLFDQYQSDIICVQEAITSDWWSFSTLQTVKSNNKTYNGFHISLFDLFYYYQPLIFRYGFFGYIIREIQTLINAYIFSPFWLDITWNILLVGNSFKRYNFVFLTGCVFQWGNAILFKNNKKLMYKSFIKLDGLRNAIRALYDMSDENGKSIWVVCTHFSATEERNTVYSEYNENDDENKENMEFLNNNRKSIGMTQCEQLIEWIENGQNNIKHADYVVIAGDFNHNYTSDLYRFMISKGYKSAVYEKYGVEKGTFYTGTYTSNEWAKSYGIKGVTFDYIWIKNCNKDNNIDIRVDECILVGDNYITDNYEDNLRIYPSDHLGIYLKISF
eukprot:436544_1